MDIAIWMGGWARWHYWQSPVILEYTAKMKSKLIRLRPGEQQQCNDIERENNKKLTPENSPPSFYPGIIMKMLMWTNR